MKSRSAHTSIYFYGRSFRKPVTRLGLLLSWENHICSGEKEGCWTRVNRSNVENMLTVSSKTFTTCMLYIRSFPTIFHNISHDIPQYDKSQVGAVSSCPFLLPFSSERMIRKGLQHCSNIALWYEIGVDVWIGFDVTVVLAIQTYTRCKLCHATLCYA